MTRKQKKPDSAMILAAGLGKRMRPITDQMPKPLVRVFGRTLLDYGLDAAKRAGVSKTVLNVHYRAEQIEDHISQRDGENIIISDERDGLLDSGGGVKKALPQLGENPFYLLNADSFWLEGIRPNLDLLAEAWNPEQMDMLLLLSGMTNAIGYNGNGDFDMSPDGRLQRRAERHITPFAYAGAAIVNPAIFYDTPDGAFSLNMLFDRAIANERLHGVHMEGIWLHVGTPDAIGEAENAIARSAA